VDLNPREDVAEEGEPPLAFEAFEKGGREDFGVVAFGRIPEEVATALEKSQTPAHACFEPKPVGEGGTAPAMPRVIGKAEGRLEEFGTYD
jgi:hypothetical protein